MASFPSNISAQMRKLWARRTGLTTVVVYLLGVELVLLLWRFIARLANPAATGPTGWMTFIGGVLAVCLLLMVVRWVRRVLMWRLRNRLVVTYVFIGVIPVVLLLAIVVITAYLFAGQFATFVITTDVHSQLKALHGMNQVLAENTAEHIKSGQSLQKAMSALRTEGTERTLTVWLQPAKGKPQVYTIPAGASEIPLAPAALAKESKAVVGRNDGLQLYAWTTVDAGNAKLTAISTEPMGKEQLQRIAADLGEITVYPPNFENEGHVRVGSGDASADVSNEGVQFGVNDRDETGDAAAQKSDAAQKTEQTQETKEAQKSESQKSEDKKSEEKKSGKEEPGKPATKPESGSGNIVIGKGNQVLVQSPTTKKLIPSLPPINAGVLAAPTGRLDREVLFGMPFSVVDWKNGNSSSALLRVRTRPSLLKGRLFVALGEFASLVFIVLTAVAIFFAVIELVALITGIRLTRTMTRSVANLYDATQHINRGDLTHRIKVKAQDQMAALETSFNSMTESLEKLIAEQKEKQRMESELAIAQEVQAQLFPREASQLDSLEVHGVCRPARTVSGDYYDFLKLGPEKLGIAVGDISGKGISAALLMATIHSAVRVYEFGRMPEREELLAAGAAAASAARGGSSLIAAGAIQSPAAVLTLLNRHLFHSTPPEKYATLFLGLWDGNARKLAYSNGGHLPPILIGSDGHVRRLEQGGMVIGLFDEMSWDEGNVELKSGDLFVAYSDGVTEPENEFGEFGEQRLIDLVMENRHLPLTRISDAVMAAVTDWIGGAEQPDDVTIVLARAR